MSEKDFAEQQREAIKRMRELNSQSVYKQPPKPAPPQQNKQESVFGGLNLPIFDKLKNDSDLTLILGILLLLLSEKSDKRLLFALIYILL